ncbi:MafI family immunity protein [Mucilaginibacter angelicae]|uniref:MafI family immunity protein n=1 Tax=Mucilaginibacter angelicae TaxID=869718 RepID=A0ABV6L4L5_9SPHI
MFGWQKERKIKSRILTLINLAGQLGLNEKDIKVAEEYLEYYEWGLSFEHLITQIFEYDVEIDQLFYKMVSDIAVDLKLPDSEYSFLLSLIKPEIS